MRSLLLSLATAVLLILTFPRFDISCLAAVALAPLLMAAASEPSPWRRLLLGEAAGVVYWFGVCYWIQFVLAYHGGLGEWGGWGTFLLFCLAKSVHLAVFTWLAGYLIHRSWAIVAIAALWVGIERTHGPLGFAWMALGNAGVDMSILMRLAPIVGVYGLSFVFAMLATGMALALLRRPRKQLAWLLLIAPVLLLPSLPEATRGEREAVSLQPNIDMDFAWTGRSVLETRQQLAYLSLESALEAGSEPPDLLVWPEVPAPFYYERDPIFRAEANNLARLTRTHFLFGTVAFTPEGAPLNSAQLISPTGAPIARYDKMFLVPFGEFIPPGFSWINRITNEGGDFAPGQQVIAPPAGDHRLGPFICYESVFPHLVRGFAAKGAEVFVNLSNDGYFGRSAARQQHLLIARMRAAENRRWILRSTNNGITASIDPAGRIVEASEEFTRTAVRLPFSYVSEKTLYTQFGDWFAWLCLVCGLAAAVVARREKG